MGKVHSKSLLSIINRLINKLKWFKENQILYNW
jgi:hypothetical protein